jgi:hypothetical protein
MRKKLRALALCKVLMVPSNSPRPCAEHTAFRGPPQGHAGRGTNTCADPAHNDHTIEAAQALNEEIA